MNIQTDPAQFLELASCPAFWVRDGVIHAVNQEASNRFLRPGDPVAPLITTGLAEYDTFPQGCLYLNLTLAGQSWGCTVLRQEDRSDLFLLTQEPADPRLQALALASQHLRQPLTDLIAVSSHLFPQLAQTNDAQVGDDLARLNRSIHQILRLVSNMSDAATGGFSHRELRDVSAVLHEIMERCTDLCAQAGVVLNYDPCPTPAYGAVDSQQLERATYQLISNAIPQLPAGEPISVRIRSRDQTLLISVTNLCHTPVELSPRMFTRFAREPGLDAFGLGLGLTLVRSVAAAHGGALLIQTEGNLLRATISLPLRRDPGDACSSHKFYMDYAGNADHGLLELSGSLPLEQYRYQ